MGLLGGIMNTLTGAGDASSAAIDAQTRATEQANATQKQIYDQQRADQTPYREAGATALSGMQNQEYMKNFTLNDFQKDPGYQFRMDEGNKAIERSAAAKGGLQSGGTLKALDQYGQNFASNEYSNAYNRFNNDQNQRFGRLSTLAGMGQGATNQTGQAAQNYGNQVSQNQIGLGNAIGAANIAGANANSQMLGGLIQGGAMLGAANIKACDRNLKENLDPVSKEDLEEFRSAFRPYRFNYINDKYGTGEQVGPMAQDLEKTKLGKIVVFKDHDGFLKIDQSKLLSIFFAAEFADAG